MTLADFVEEFTIAVDFADPVEIRADSVISDLDGWDSLAQLGVIILFDRDFQKTITADDIAKCLTVSDLYSMAQDL